MEYSFNTVFNQLSTILQITSNIYNLYRFSGQQLFNTSLDYAGIYKGYQFFGETALSGNGGIATINGLLATLDQKIDFALLHRYYSPNYQTLNGNAFGESSALSNESGLYTGLKTELYSGLSVSGYFDAFSFPWLRYNVDGPSKGYEYFLRADYAPNYYLSVYMQYRYEEKERNKADNLTAIDFLIPTKRQSLRTHLAYKVNDEFTIKSRVIVFL